MKGIKDLKEENQTKLQTKYIKSLTSKKECIVIAEQTTMTKYYKIKERKQKMWILKL